MFLLTGNPLQVQLISHLQPLNPEPDERCKDRSREGYINSKCPPGLPHRLLHGNLQSGRCCTPAAIPVEGLRQKNIAARIEIGVSGTVIGCPAIPFCIKPLQLVAITDNRRAARIQCPEVNAERSLVIAELNCSG